MNSPLRISDVRLAKASLDDQERGLIGWLRFVVNDSLVVDNVTVRRTRDGRLVLSFPTRHDRAGHQRAIVRPVDATARLDIERQVFEALERKQETSP